MSIIRSFTEHPKSVGETYRVHAGVAAKFGVMMITGGIASLIHALFPFVFEKAGSRTIRHLHSKLVVGSRDNILKSRSAAIPPTIDDALSYAEL